MDSSSSLGNHQSTLSSTGDQFIPNPSESNNNNSSETLVLNNHSQSQEQHHIDSHNLIHKETLDSNKHDHLQEHMEEYSGNQQTLNSENSDSHNYQDNSKEKDKDDNKIINIDNSINLLKAAVVKPLLSGNGVTSTYSGTDKECSGGEEETTSRRRRRSRWDPPPSETDSDGAGTGKRKRKSRWEDDPKPVVQLPGFVTDLTAGIEFDPQIQVLNARLLEISRKLQSGLPLDDRPEGARSPSPEPVYDNMGVRINTREYRARERLNRERQEIISHIIKMNPAFKPPADYRPPKLHKKLYIPMKEYPGYNFIGLIIGPRGNTQKRMEKETGAKIVIRGKGSIKEGRLLQKRDLKPDPSENEDLHVLVEAETQEALDAASGMVEKLLKPVDEVLNEHKRQQLKELAALNGTIRDEEFCRLCGEPGHRQYACHSRTSTFKSDVLCRICGDGGHPTIDCPVKGSTGKKMDEEYQNFLAELGGTVPESSTKIHGGTLALGPGSLGSNPPWANDNNSGVVAGISQPGIVVVGVKQSKEYDETNLYVGHLPPNFEDADLIRLFSPFGMIVMSKVIKDRVTCLSKGYGFVKYSDVQQANSAIAAMNGHLLDGRPIAVRVAGKPPQPVVPSGPPLTVPTCSAVNQPVSAYPRQQFTSGAPIALAPTGSYGSPVPWGPPVPAPFAPYPLTAGSTMYAAAPAQPMAPYGIQYPPSVQPVSNVITTTVISGENPHASSAEPQQSDQSGVPSQTSAADLPVPTYVYGSSIAVVPQNAQSAYVTPSFVYPPCYGVAPPPPAPVVIVPPSVVGTSESIGSVPWASNPTGSTPVSSTEKTNNGADAEYEKFMAEMK